MTSQFYIGYREVNKLPSNQDLPLYQTSSTKIKELGFENFDWIILAEFFNGDDAYDFEQDLIKENFYNSLCLNRHYHRNGNKFKQIGPHSNETKLKQALLMKGRTKLNDPGKAITAVKLTGRTKETHSYIKEQAKKISLALSGRTKESHQYIANVAALFSNRTKENHAGVASQAAKIRGRTKENHAGVAEHSKKMKGRTKENHVGVASQAAKIKGRTKETHNGLKIMSEKKRKISEVQDKLIYDLHQSGKTFKEIKNMLELNDVHYQTIVNASHRGYLMILEPEK